MFKFSVTGADNNVDISELKKLVSQYPLLELAILYFPEKENVQRNPGLNWRNDFFNQISKENTAIHLCGQSVFDTILENDFENTIVFNELKKTSRIQININARKNIFTTEQIHNIYTILLKNEFNLILQYHERSKDWIIPFLIKNSQYLNQIDILLDSSLGKGVTPVGMFHNEDKKTFNIGC